jgi:hypothetical protein
MGDWTLVEEGDLDDSALEILRCFGSFRNVYQHIPTKSIVQVAVMYGPRGPIAVHTPEVCYSSQGTTETKSREVETVESDGKTNEFWSVEFAYNDDPDSFFEVWYAWSAGEEWVAAEHPRFWLTEDLFKIQLSGPSRGTSFSPCKSLLTALLPHLQQHIK